MVLSLTHSRSNAANFCLSDMLHSTGLLSTFGRGPIYSILMSFIKTSLADNCCSSQDLRRTNASCSALRIPASWAGGKHVWLIQTGSRAGASSGHWSWKAYNGINGRAFHFLHCSLIRVFYSLVVSTVFIMPSQAPTGAIEVLVLDSEGLKRHTTDWILWGGWALYIHKNKGYGRSQNALVQQTALLRR